MRQNLGEFIYNDQLFEQELGAREQRIVVTLENGAKYEGEWLIGT